MGTKFKLLTWNIEEEVVFSRDFRNENEAIQTAEALSRRNTCPHEVVSIIRTKKTGHRWELAVWNIDKPQKMEYVLFYSKKDAIFARKKLKEYDDTLKTNLIKIY